jgi:hypothetical protein
MFEPSNIRNLAKEIINEGGEIVPLMIDASGCEGWSQTNPTILIHNNEILVNLRCVEYSLIHSDKKQKYWSRWGPLTYSHTENELALKTINYLCKLNPNTLEIEKHARIDTSELDIPPVWEFHGLEDIRLAFWNNKLYGIGVRRDVKPNGEGRMEYQEIEYSFNDEPYATEVKRNRIQPPIDLNSYCEKNWMPILDMPNHFVKWSNPAEIVEANLKDNSSIRKVLSEKNIAIGRDLRGGSQVIKWNDGWLAVTHELLDMRSDKTLQNKDAYYFSRFVYWNSEWEIEWTSEDFSILDGRIEFVTGIADLNEDFVLITFGFCDSSAYICKMPKTLINKMLNIQW